MNVLASAALAHIIVALLLINRGYNSGIRIERDDEWNWDIQVEQRYFRLAVVWMLVFVCVCMCVFV